MTNTVVVTNSVPNIVVVQETLNNLVVSTPGPQGPAGSVANVFYTHYQSIPSNVWTIDHNLNQHPVAVVIDSGGTSVDGTNTYPSSNQMVITFSASFGGTAYII